jgi:hypothetical protein
MQRLTLIGLLLALGCLTGCSSIRLSEADRASIDSVKFRTEEGRVSYSGTLPSEYEPDTGSGLLSNPYTAPIGLVYEIFRYPAVVKKRSHTLKRIFAHKKIDVPEIVGATFRDKLEEEDLLPLVESDDPESDTDAELVLTTGYGVKEVSMLQDAWAPWLEVTAVLTDNTGKELWRRTTFLDGNHPVMRELPFPDPFSDRKLLRRLFRVAAKAASEELLEHLSGT